MTSHWKQVQLSYKIVSGKNSMTSKAGWIVLPLYDKNIGLIVFSAKKAPFFKLKIHDPFVVPPSAKIRNGAYYPVYSMSSYLSRMAAKAWALFSGEPPLGI